MTDRTTTIIIMNEKSKKYKIVVEVPQDSSLFSILYLFYVAELLDSCNSSPD
jgi:hypothetical protein